MKRIIDRKVYDTKKMKELVSVSLGSQNHNDFNYHDMDLLHDGNTFFVAHFYYHSDSNTLENLIYKDNIYDWLEEYNIEPPDELLKLLGE